jgi:hypothetical protein
MSESKFIESLGQSARKLVKLKSDGKTKDVLSSSLSAE